MAKRDEFNKDVKETLADRVANHCSICGDHTSGPSDEGSDKAVQLGVAAHITAAAEGGPRYDPSLTARERKSAENGIWCCQKHGKLVDNDKTAFRVEELRRRKALMEASIRADNHGGDPFASPRALPPGNPTLARLQREFREKLDTVAEFREYVEELQHWMAHEARDPRGIAQKLGDAHREDEIARAERLKEKFVKKLIRHQWSEPAQNVFACLLAELESHFHRRIVPRLREGAARKAVDELVHSEVVSPILRDLGTNDLLLMRDDLEGMLYFLTGNCYIAWNA